MLINGTEYYMGSSVKLDNATVIIGDGCITTWDLMRDNPDIAEIASYDGSPLEIMPDDVKLLDNGMLRIDRALRANYAIIVRFRSEEHY